MKKQISKKTKAEDSGDEEGEDGAKDKNQNEDKDDDGVDLEDYLYRVYFRDEELNRVKEA